MVVENIYVVRHGFRMNWVINPETGDYYSTYETPTGNPSDPALAAYGVDQSKQLAEHLCKVEPPVDVIYSSPFYRCLQTLKPTAEKLFAEGKAGGKIRVDNGLGEFYGLARFTHPSPAPLEVLHTHFPSLLHPDHTPTIIPSTNGETIPALHDRVAYALHRIIEAHDQDPHGPKTILICTHAATMIAIGRALTGRMPDDVAEGEWRCFTCSFSHFRRKGREVPEEQRQVAPWRPEDPERIPDTRWRGRGVRGGWECLVNGDCSFLTNGEERGWQFSGDEVFLNDPNAYNDRINKGTATPVIETTADDGAEVRRLETSDPEDDGAEVKVFKL